MKSIIKYPRASWNEKLYFIHVRIGERFVLRLGSIKTKWRFHLRNRRNPTANRLEAILCFEEDGGTATSLFILSELMAREMAQAHRARTCFPASCKFLNCIQRTSVFQVREPEGFW